MSDAEILAAYEEAGGPVERLVAKLLVDAQFTNVFTQSLSPLACAEPIVVMPSGYERDSEQVGSERGERVVEVVVCREVNAAAEAVALACERSLRTTDWGTHPSGYLCRIVGLDTDAPDYRGRDGSGRYLWGFKAYVTVAREP